MDIQGAFDTVLRNRLLLRLREQGEPNSRFGYADDVATLIRGRSLQETAARATRAAGELIQWGADNGVVKEPQQDLRWLGVWYDRKLSFRTHVEKWAAKAMTAAGFLQNLSNTRRGILPVDTACGHGLRPPDPLYGAHVWYPGRFGLIQLTLNVAMRAIAPVWCTMPIVALHRETGIPPATLLLADAQRRAATKRRRRDFNSWLRVCPEDTLIVYTDGSQSEDGACGTPDQQCRIVVCLDNSAAIRAIRGSPSISSQAAAEKFAEAAARHGDVRTRWCPGHTGIAGNERADQLAKEGCRALGPDRPPTYANIKRQAKAAARRDFQDWWAAGAPSSYKSLGLKASLGAPGLHTKRQHLHHLLAARSGHGDFAGCHERFNHEEARIECSCGGENHRHTPSTAGR
ncbi:RNase H domain-containing protein [Hirsutella rhossiliensis]|uniref:RNase H domain-containing protein n=1 Tax=Hirsutella rhossiliensis TaxID=111463 RepID=A0A9P8SF14_9HYPO|nr:RNase H domain-containing protein [Hirsutella rhossiliensis]KAH0960408.1 RNase H domain-containing protein [Hirsutella rhossiliensis]